MNKYQNQKKQILKNINKFDLSDDLVAGSTSVATFIQILKENECLEILNRILKKHKVGLSVNPPIKPKTGARSNVI